MLAQDPLPDAPGAEQPSVSLLVAAPMAIQEKAWVMPDVVGKPYAEAAALLERAGLRVSQGMGGLPPTAVAQPPEPAPGTVLAQAPEAGFRVGAGAQVTLWTAPANR